MSVGADREWLHHSMSCEAGIVSRTHQIWANAAGMAILRAVKFDIPRRKRVTNEIISCLTCAMRTRFTLNRNQLNFFRHTRNSLPCSGNTSVKWCAIFHLSHCQRTKIAGSVIREFHIENDDGGEEAAENGRINQDWVIVFTIIKLVGPLFANRRQMGKLVDGTEQTRRNPYRHANF